MRLCQKMTFELSIGERKTKTLDTKIIMNINGLVVCLV